MAQTGVDLTKIFQSVTQTLAQNQQALNDADDRNHDHGTNMVQTFQTITGALQKKTGSSPNAVFFNIPPRVAVSRKDSSFTSIFAGSENTAANFSPSGSGATL